MFRHRKYILGMFLAIFLVFLIFIMTPIGFPYREQQSEQRYTIWVSWSLKSYSKPYSLVGLVLAYQT